MEVVVQSARSLGRALRDARRGSGLTQHQLAALSGVAQPTISIIERGVKSASLDTLLRLLAALRLELVLRPRATDDLASHWQQD